MVLVGITEYSIIKPLSHSLFYVSMCYKISRTLNALQKTTVGDARYTGDEFRQPRWKLMDCLFILRNFSLKIILFRETVSVHHLSPQGVFTLCFLNMIR